MKMNELSQALDELVSCGEALIRTANAIREMFTSEPEDQTVPAPAAEEPQKRYTFVEVRKAFSAKSHAGHTKQVRELIAKYGADKLSAVKEEDYPALMAELGEIK